MAKPEINPGDKVQTPDGREGTVKDVGFDFADIEDKPGLRRAVPVAQLRKVGRDLPSRGGSYYNELQRLISEYGLEWPEVKTKEELEKTLTDAGVPLPE